MRSWIASLVAVLFAGFATPSILASTLPEKNFETGFTFSYVDVNDFGKTTNLDGQWQWLFGKGSQELGAKLSYLSVNPDTGSSNDATIFGPVYTWNWMPEKEKFTGFLEAFYGFVSGDLGDVADNEVQGSVGAKVFVGNSAAVRFDYFVDKVMGANGAEDVDSSGIRIGISIFGGEK